MGIPPGNNGMAGQDGLDGRPGSDGNPGKISVTYDPSAKPYLAALRVPKSASLQEAAVQPLW